MTGGQENKQAATRDEREEDIVASEFGGLDNDLVDVGAFDGSGKADVAGQGVTREETSEKPEADRIPNAQPGAPGPVRDA